MVEERFALLAVMTHRIMLAVVAHTATDTTRGFVDRRVEVTARSVTVTLASCNTRPPQQHTQTCMRPSVQQS